MRERGKKNEIAHNRFESVILFITKNAIAKTNIKAQTLDTCYPHVKFSRIIIPVQKIWTEHQTRLYEKYEISLCSWSSREPSDLLSESHVKYTNRYLWIVMFIGIHFFDFLAQGYATFNINTNQETLMLIMHNLQHLKTIHISHSQKCNWYWNSLMYF